MKTDMYKQITKDYSKNVSTIRNNATRRFYFRPVMGGVVRKVALLLRTVETAMPSILVRRNK